MDGRGRRVAVTGLGVVAPCGIGRDAYWRGLLGPGITSGRSSEIQDWDPSPWYDSPKESRRADPVEQYAQAAAAEAFAHAGWSKVISAEIRADSAPSLRPVSAVCARSSHRSAPGREG